ncbi:hypothetical protein [Aureliella helgolandensis]|uniref:Uncharacterized protein n=1 Tax=Aureliella helgolandensis TaxID=2527968 RepID=A0A518G5I0_9BACT|nr:hypothetical protein [Aureliella helgolandensis]QDV23838.1 hypothetical protein Q31a_21440 [Aureliella helgolandensis]
MRFLLVAITCCSLMTLFVSRGLTSDKKEQGVSELILEYGRLVRRVGKSHPSIAALHREIEYCIDDGDNKLDKRALSNELDVEFRKYRELRDQVGLAHPSTQDALHKISIVSRLMVAGDVVTHANLDSLLPGAGGADRNKEGTRRTTD